MLGLGRGIFVDLDFNLRIDFWWNSVFFKDFVQDVEFFNVFGVVQVVVGNDLGEGTRREWEEDHAHELQKYTHESLNGAGQGYVPVAHSRERLHREIHRNCIKLSHRFIFKLIGFNPRVSAYLIRLRSLGNIDPHTAYQVAYEQKCQKEEHQSLKALTEFDDSVHLMLNDFLMLHNLHHPYEPRDLDQFIELAHSRDPYKLIHFDIVFIVISIINGATAVILKFIDFFDNDFKRNDRQEIDKEPWSYIVDGYCFSVIDHSITFIIIGAVEIDDDIEEEENVDTIIQIHVPLHIIDLLAVG